MPRKSSVLKHDQIDQIDADLLGGMPVTQVSEKYGIAYKTLLRYKNNTLVTREDIVNARTEAAVRDALRANVPIDGGEIMRVMMDARDRLEALLYKAEQEGGKAHTIISAIGNQLKWVDTAVKMATSTKMAEAEKKIEETERALRAVTRLIDNHPKLEKEFRAYLRAE